MIVRLYGITAASRISGWLSKRASSSAGGTYYTNPKRYIFFACDLVLVNANRSIMHFIQVDTHN